MVPGHAHFQLWRQPLRSLSVSNGEASLDRLTGFNATLKRFDCPAVSHCVVARLWSAILLRIGSVGRFVMALATVFELFQPEKGFLGGDARIELVWLRTATRHRGRISRPALGSVLTRTFSLEVHRQSRLHHTAPNVDRIVLTVHSKFEIVSAIKCERRILSRFRYKYILITHLK